MVTTDITSADVIFLIEGTAINGAYINDIKTFYVVPTVEYFSQSNLDYTTLFGIVVYKTAQAAPGVTCTTYGPFSSASTVLNTIDKLELTGGKSESYANLSEGMATALVCFDDLKDYRDDGTATQKHCILICNSAPYFMPVTENSKYENKTVEQLASIFHESSINFSILSPRKIPVLFKIFEKSGGDLTSSATKNYCKDPRHLVLLKGYSLKERPISPTMKVLSPSPNVNQQNAENAATIPNSTASQMESGNIMVQPNINNLPNMRPNMNPQQGNFAFNQMNNPGQMRPMMVQQQNMAGNMGQQQQIGGNQPGHVMSFNAGMINRQMNPNAARRMPGPNPGQQQQTAQQQAPQRFVGQVQQQNPGMQQQQMQQQNVNQQQMQNQNQQQQMQNPNQQQMGNMNQMPNMQMGQNQQVQPQQQTSVLISQLSTPPNTMNPQNMNNIRLQMMNQQQQQQNPGMQNMGNPQMTQSSGSVQGGQQMGQVMQKPGGSAPSGPMAGTNPTSTTREKIWNGILEWIDKSKTDQTKVPRQVPCYVTATVKDGEPELKADSWPSKLIMQLMPKQLVGTIGGQYLKDSKSVMFHPNACEALDALSNTMGNGFAGCVHFNAAQHTNCDIKVLILLYTAEKKAFVGFIPNNQFGFVERLRKVIQQKQEMNQQGGMQNQQQHQQQQQVVGNQGGNVMNQGGNANVGGNAQGGGVHENMMWQMGGGQGQMQQQNRMGMNVMHVQNPGQQQMPGNSMDKMSMDGQGGDPQQQNFNQFRNYQFNQQGGGQQMPNQQMMDFGQMDQMGMQQQGQPNQQMQQQQMQQQMNQQRRPITANNPGLRHLLQQQQQQPQYRQQPMGMQNMNQGQMGVRPQQNQNPNQMQQGFEDFDY